MMGSCGACGHGLAAVTKFCPECGQSTSMHMIELHDSGASAAWQTGRPSSSPIDRRRSSASLILLALVAVAAVVVGLSSFGNAADPQPRDPDAGASGDRPAEAELANPREPETATAAGVAAEPVDFPVAAPVRSSGGANDSVSAAYDAARGVLVDDLLAADLPAEVLAIVSAPDSITLFDLQTGTPTSWEPPERLVAEAPVAVAGSLVVVGEAGAWTRPLWADVDGPGESAWTLLGEADRVRFSTKPDRVWLRQPNPKVRPSDAEYLWNEVDLAGELHRTMFRDREIYFPTPELVAGIGGDLFRLTDATINAWRLFSPYGVLIATGHHDLIVKECTANGDCKRVWYDTTTGEPRGSVFGDLAQQVDASYGARLSLDGRFVYSKADGEATTFVRSVATGDVIENECRWSAPLVWTAGSEAFACATQGGLVQLYETANGVNLGLPWRGESADPQLVFVPK